MTLGVGNNVTSIICCKLRMGQCQTLGKLPADELVKLKDRIVPLLKDEDSDVRGSACETLGKLPPDELVKLKDHIVPFLKDEVAFVHLGSQIHPQRVVG